MPDQWTDAATLSSLQTDSKTKLSCYLASAYQKGLTITPCQQQKPNAAWSSAKTPYFDVRE